MKLHLERAAGFNAITAHDTTSITVNGIPCSHSIVVPHQGAVSEQPGLAFETLTESIFAQLALAKPELVLLGTGQKQRFPNPKLIAALTNSRIGVEVMTTGAACRTFNILVAEGRQCVALLLK